MDSVKSGERSQSKRTSSVTRSYRPVSEPMEHSLTKRSSNEKRTNNITNSYSAARSRPSDRVKERRPFHSSDSEQQHRRQNNVPYSLHPHPDIAEKRIDAVNDRLFEIAGYKKRHSMFNHAEQKGVNHSKQHYQHKQFFSSARANHVDDANVLSVNRSTTEPFSSASGVCHQLKCSVRD